MDDDKDKNAIEKLVDKINGAVENITTTVSDAVQHAMEPDPVKLGEQPVAYMPIALADPMMPPFVVIPRRKKSTSKNVPKESGKKAAKKTVKKSAKKAAAKLSAQKKKKAAKAWKPTAGRKSVGRKKTEEGCKENEGDEVEAQVNSTLKVQTPETRTLIDKIKADLKTRADTKAKRMLLKKPKRQAKR
jgi:hypothetical protein